MELRTMFLTLYKSIMLLPYRSVEWHIEDKLIIMMDTKTFIVRSFAEELLSNGVPEDDIKAALNSLDAGKEEYPTGESYSVIFH